MRKIKLMALFAAVGAVFSGLFAGDFAIRDLKLDHPEGFYKKGEEIVVTGCLLKGGKPAPEYKLRVTTKLESVRAVAKQEFSCGKPFRVTYTGTEPGWVYFTFQVIGPDGKVVKLPGPKVVQSIKKELVDEIGAMVAPEEIRGTEERPADFDEFWKAELAKLDAVPMNPRLEKIPSGREGIDLYTVKLDTGLDWPVTAYLAIPTGAEPKSMPIYLTFLDGVLGDAYRSAVLNMAERGAVAMISTWHGYDVNRDKKYYKEVGGKLKSWETAKGGREAFHQHKIFLRAYRAAQYLKTRPEWNGKDFLVQGGSLAGAQAAAVAALDKDVTIAFIHTPSSCGYNADLAGRKSAHPYHWVPKSWFTPEIRQAIPYSDVIHLAKNIRCESYFCTGFTDEMCTPTGVYAAFNNVPGSTRKVMTTNPHTGHYAMTKDYRAQRRLEEFFRNLYGPKGFRGRGRP